MTADNRDHKDFSVSRPQATMVVGAVVAILGSILFLAAHAICTPGPGQVYSIHECDLREILWCVFGTTMMLGGLGIVAVGLSAWCSNETI
jgi:hypothetical protein